MKIELTELQYLRATQAVLCQCGTMPVGAALQLACDLINEVLANLNEHPFLWVEFQLAARQDRGTPGAPQLLAAALQKHQMYLHEALAKDLGTLTCLLCAVFADDSCLPPNNDHVRQVYVKAFTELDIPLTIEQHYCEITEGRQCDGLLLPNGDVLRPLVVWELSSKQSGQYRVLETADLQAMGIFPEVDGVDRPVIDLPPEVFDKSTRRPVPVVETKQGAQS